MIGCPGNCATCKVKLEWHSHVFISWIENGETKRQCDACKRYEEIAKAHSAINKDLPSWIRIPDNYSPMVITG